MENYICICRISMLSNAPAEYWIYVAHKLLLS